MSPHAHTDLQAALVAELRSNASAGYDEWRVQDPKDGSYCVAYSWPDTMDPERDARAWLADHRARFPCGRYVDYVVASVRVVPKKDRLLAQAADSLERCSAALDAEHAQRIALQHHAADQAQAMADMQKNIQYLEGVRQGWSAHAADQAQRVADLEAEIERLRGLLRRERDELAARTRELTLYAAGVEAERNELAARLAEIEAQEPPEPCQACGGSGWVTRDPDIGTDTECPACSAWPYAGKEEEPAPERAAPDHCEDERGMVCRCGPDSVACPKGGAA